MSDFRALFALVTVLALAMSFCASAEEATTTDSPEPGAQGKDGGNRYDSIQDIAQGRQLVLAYCSRCHGKDATGGKGPDLTRGMFRHGASDEALFRNIRDGIPRTGMPGTLLPDDWAGQIISFIRSWSSPPTEKLTLTGNTRNGEQFFFSLSTSANRATGPAPAGGGKVPT